MPFLALACTIWFACPAVASPPSTHKDPVGRIYLLGMGKVRTIEFEGVASMLKYPYKHEVSHRNIVPNLSFDEAQKGLMCGRLRSCMLIDELMCEDSGANLDFRVIRCARTNLNIAIFLSPVVRRTLRNGRSCVR
jgi:hypothetical protein